MDKRRYYTVTAVDTSNAASYIKFIVATSPEEARTFVEAEGLRVDAVELTPAYLQVMRPLPTNLTWSSR
jgi:hypothetical protein